MEKTPQFIKLCVVCVEMIKEIKEKKNLDDVHSDWNFLKDGKILE